MKKALGVLFTWPYQSHEAHGTFGAEECFHWSGFIFSSCPHAVWTPAKALFAAAEALTDTVNGNYSSGSTQKQGLATVRVGNWKFC